MSKSKILALVIALLVAVGVFLAIKMYNKPHRDIAKEKAAFSLSADALYSAYEADETAADAKYLDKVIEVSGVISDWTVNQDGLPTGILEAQSAMIGGVSVTMKENVSLKNGESVVLKCRCTGMLMDVVLVDCSKK